MYEKKCVECGLDFSSFWASAVVCSDDCRNVRRRKHYGPPLYPKNLSSSCVGTIHEYKAFILLSELGVSVYNQFIPGSMFDAVAITNSGKILKVEVKTSYINNSTGRLIIPKCKHQIDLLIVYIKSVDKLYFIIGDKQVTAEEISRM